jgi:hypothetical protein
MVFKYIGLDVKSIQKQTWYSFLSVLIRQHYNSQDYQRRKKRDLKSSIKN